MLTLTAMQMGCGGSDSTDTVTTDAQQGFFVRASTAMTVASPRIDDRKFAALINKTCRKGWKVIQQNFIEYRSWLTPPETRRGRFEKTVQLSLLAGIDFYIFDPIQNLGSAPGESQGVEELLGAMQKPVELGQQKYWRAHTLAEVPPHFSDYNRRARQYGIDDCVIEVSNLKPIEASA